MGAVLSRIIGLLLSPFVTIPLLAVLLRGPDSVRDHVSNVVANYKYGGNQLVTLPRLISALKWIAGLGTVVQVNGLLDDLSVNHWTWGKNGVPWNFSNFHETVLITGGCSGFGKLMAQRFSGKTKLVILDVSPLPADMKSIPHLKYYTCDLTNTEAVVEVAKKVKAEVGDPTVLINNAGIGGSAFILDTNPKFLEKIFALNIVAHWTMVREFLPGMLKQKKGHVVTIASMASFVSVCTIVDYCATKSALVAFHEGLSQELKYKYENGNCIQTSIVHPSWASTALIKDYEKDLKKANQAIMDPKVVADAIVGHVKKGRSGRLVVPKLLSGAARLRGLPMWLQEAVRGTINSQAANF